MYQTAAQAALEYLLAPLQAALDDAEVTEILVNAPDAAWIERRGQLATWADPPDPAQLRAIARLVATLSRNDSLDRDGTLEGAWREWRVTMALPPVSGDHPCLAMRRHARTALPLHRWAALAQLPPAATSEPANRPVASGAGACRSTDALAGLRLALERHDNLLIAGATGSGKTTLLASLLAELGSRERLVCLEDTPELPHLGPHQLRLYARQGHDLRSLLRLALRLRPDRIVVGEVRGAEAFDLLQAMATGHRGCLATIHAADAQGALQRFEQLILTAGLGWPLPAVRAQLASTLQQVVLARRTPSGRAIGEIRRVAGLKDGALRLLPPGDGVHAAPARTRRAAADAAVPAAWHADRHGGGP